jgi:hypothetical protein
MNMTRAMGRPALIFAHVHHHDRSPRWSLGLEIGLAAVTHMAVKELLQFPLAARAAAVPAARLHDLLPLHRQARLTWLARPNLRSRYQFKISACVKASKSRRMYILRWISST